MHKIARSLVVLGALAVAAAVVLVLVPLSANGVSGSALVPHYSHYFAFSSYDPLPLNPTRAQLRHAGVRLPQDVVASRRKLAYVIAGSGVLVALIGGFIVFRGRRHPGSRPAAG